MIFTKKHFTNTTVWQCTMFFEYYFCIRVQFSSTNIFRNLKVSKKRRRGTDRAFKPFEKELRVTLGHHKSFITER